jgi:hypothetical protein
LRGTQPRASVNAGAAQHSAGVPVAYALQQLINGVALGMSYGLIAVG